MVNVADVFFETTRIILPCKWEERIGQQYGCMLRRFCLSVKFVFFAQSTVVAIGIADGDSYEPVGFAGTGSFISADGYILTAWHVLDSCESNIRKYRNRKLEVVIFRIASNGSNLRFNIVPLDRKIKVRIKSAQSKYAGPFDLDIGIAKVKVRSNSLPHLRIREQKSNLYEDITICSYPNPKQSLVIFKRLDNYSGLRFSPILQFGRTTAFMPEDNHINPYGLQTDIVGTGGTSGSPIVSEDCKIVGLAQQVITAETYNKREKPSGDAKIGLIFGPTNSILLDCYTSARDLLEKGRSGSIIIKASGYTNFKISRND
jgi:hypothetical protein